MKNIIDFTTTTAHRRIKPMDKIARLNEYVSTIKRTITVDRNKISPLEVADKIIQIWEVTSPPIPIIELSKALGFRVFQQEYFDDDDTLSGFIAINNCYRDMFGTDKLISLNKKDNLGHKCFTIAHELCHYIYDFNPYTMSSYSDPYITTNADDPAEQQANTFAANLLMPAEMFIKENKKLEEQNVPLYESIGELAEIFRVSSSAVIKRFGEIEDDGKPT